MFGLLAALSVLLAPAGGISAEPALPLPAPGQWIERELPVRQQDEFFVDLAVGQCLHVVVEQKGLDLVEELVDPRGRLVLRVDTPRAAYGPETLWALAATPGRHRLRIRGLFAETGGRYALRVQAVRPGSREDRARAAALRVHMRSRDFEDRSTEASRRASRLGLEEASRLWRAIDDPEQEALVWLDRARFDAASGNSRAALDAAAQALVYARAAGDRQLEGRILQSRGLALENLGDPRGGIEALDEALNAARAVGDRQQEAATIHLQAWGHWNLGQYQKAFDLDQLALSIGRAIRDPEIQAWSLNGLGLTYSTLGDPEKSLGVFEEALGDWRRLGDRGPEAFTLQNIGFCYWELGNPGMALGAYRQALSVVRALGDRQGEALALNNIGLAEIALGQPAPAADTLAEAIALWKRIRYGHGLAMSWLNLGTAQEDLGRPEEALASWKAALGAARAAGDRRNEAAVLTLMARLELRRGRPESARPPIEESLAITESLREPIAAPSLRSSFLSMHQDEFAIAMDVHVALDALEPGGRHAAEAFEASEKARARALLEGITEARIDLAAEMPEDLRRLEEELGLEIKQLQGELSRARGAERAEIERRLDGAEDAWERFLAETRRRVPPYASLRYPEPVRADAARASLGLTTAVVSYSISAERVLVFVLTRSRLAVYRLAVPPPELSERVEHFVALIAGDEDDRWRRLGGRLWADLVGPWLGELPRGVRHLVVVPDGILDSLPFEALAPSAPGARRLVEEYVVSYAPSVTALGELERHSRPAAAVADMLVVADPLLGAARAFSPDDGSEGAFDVATLPRAAAEGRAVARYGGPGTEVLTGAEASERRLRQAPLERFAVIHFATHGLLDARHPSRSGLLLAGGDAGVGLLTAREIYRLKLRSDLVVLAACQTGRGRILAGEGVQSLAGAFFHAGANAVVATLWNVNDRRAERLMRAFYDRLADGDSKAEALAAAKRRLLAREPGLAPRFWAPFVLLGEARGSVPLRRLSWWQALLAP